MIIENILKFEVGKCVENHEKNKFYRIIEKIGEGGFSKVFKVEDINDTNKK